MKTCWWSHDWKKFGRPEEGVETFTLDGIKIRTNNCWVQRRTCKRCGEDELKKVSA